MANPARVTRQFIGVFDPFWLRPMAETLANLGTASAWIFHGAGLDELVLEGENQLVALKDGEISEFTLNAAEAGLAPAPLAAIKGGDAAYNAAALRALLAGEKGAYRDTILLNAAAALIVAGSTISLHDGVAMAADAIDSGRAAKVLAALIEASREVTV
jgi:anthranilate phosphoribosyltransferase